jgi:hypothetical protein
MENLKAHDVYELVPRTRDMRTLGLGWVLHRKFKNGVFEKNKGCLVARGNHQRPGIDWYRLRRVSFYPRHAAVGSGSRIAIPLGTLLALALATWRDKLDVIHLCDLTSCVAMVLRIPPWDSQGEGRGYMEQLGKAMLRSWTWDSQGELGMARELGMVP